MQQYLISWGLNHNPDDIDFPRTPSDPSWVHSSVMLGDLLETDPARKLLFQLRRVQSLNCRIISVSALIGRVKDHLNFCAGIVQIRCDYFGGIRSSICFFSAGPPSGRRPGLSIDPHRFGQEYHRVFRGAPIPRWAGFGSTDRISILPLFRTPREDCMSWG